MSHSTCCRRPGFIELHQASACSSRRRSHATLATLGWCELECQQLRAALGFRIFRIYCTLISTMRLPTSAHLPSPQTGGRALIHISQAVNQKLLRPGPSGGRTSGIFVSYGYIIIIINKVSFCVYFLCNVTPEPTQPGHLHHLHHLQHVAGVAWLFAKLFVNSRTLMTRRIAMF